MEIPNIEALPTLTADDPNHLGHIVGARYQIWTGDVDEVLGFHNGWVYVQDVKTKKIRAHLTGVGVDRRVHCVCGDRRCYCECFTGGWPCEHGEAGAGC